MCLTQNRQNVTYGLFAYSSSIVNGSAKSRTTWLQQILNQIRTAGDESIDAIYKVTWYFRSQYLEIILLLEYAKYYLTA